MIIKFDEKEYNLDLDEMDFTEARYIFRQTGLSILKFQEAVLEGNPEALAACWWLVNKRAGRNTDIGKENFKAVKFYAAIVTAVAEGMKTAAEKAEKENPTEVPGDGDTAGK